MSIAINTKETFDKCYSPSLSTIDRVNTLKLVNRNTLPSWYWTEDWLAAYISMLSFICSFRDEINDCR